MYVDPKFKNPTNLKAWLGEKAELHLSQTCLERLEHNLDVLARVYAENVMVPNVSYSAFNQAVVSLKGDDFAYSISLNNSFLLANRYYVREKDTNLSFFRNVNGTFLKRLCNGDPIGYDKVWFEKFFSAFLKIREKDNRLGNKDAVKEFLLHWLCHPKMDFDTLDVSTDDKINEWLNIKQSGNN